MPAISQDQALAQVVQQIAPQGRLVRWWPIPGGISAEMAAVAFQQMDGRLEKIIVRRPGKQTFSENPLAAENEYRTLAITRSVGLATPAPITLDVSGNIFPEPYLVIEYIDGEPDFSLAHAGSLARQMVEHLARIHTARFSTPDRSFLLEIPRSLAVELDRQPFAASQAFAAEAIGNTLRNAWPFPQRNEPVLLHGDYWPGNLLWRNGQLAAVVDWEDACIGDPLLDFAISRLDILWIFGRDAFQAFTQQYLAGMAIDTTTLPYWDLYAALRLARLAGPDLAAWANFFRPVGRADITGQTILDQTRYFISRAYEQIGLGGNWS